MELFIQMLGSIIFIASVVSAVWYLWSADRDYMNGVR